MRRFVIAAVVLVGACRSQPRPLVHPSVGADATESRVKLGAATTVLYILDGRELASDDSSGVPAAVRHLDPAKIDHVEVLKGEAARTSFGARGASGVVLITTKQTR